MVIETHCEGQGICTARYPDFRLSELKLIKLLTAHNDLKFVIVVGDRRQIIDIQVLIVEFGKTAEVQVKPPALAIQYLLLPKF